MKHNRLIGKKGEKIAENYLIKKKYKILSRNFFVRGGEIDIIALDKKELVFVEVKTRTGNKFGFPEESIGQKKINCIIRAGFKFIEQENYFDAFWRIDVISIFIFNKQTEIFHLNNVYEI